jgi:hypothetical protein
VGSGTNTRHAVKGVSYVRFQLESGGFMGIEHMLYLLELKVNLLSLSTFEDEGYVVASTSVFKGRYSGHNNGAWCQKGEII